MRRSCCVLNCESCNKKAFNNLRSFFKLPSKDDELYCNFVRQLGEHFNRTKATCKEIYICDLHFTKDCFHTQNSIISKDGEVVQMQRQRLRLKKNAVPTIFPIKSEPIDDFTYQSYKVNDEKVSDCTVLRDSVNLQKNLSSSPIHYVHKNIFIVKSHENPMKPTTGIHDDSHQECIVSELPALSKPYSIKLLRQDWRSVEQQNMFTQWGPLNSSFGILFAYTGDDNISVTRTVLVKYDMTTQIRVRDRPSEHPNINQINCLDDLLEALAHITSLQMCQGNGDAPCPNGLFRPLPKSKSLRCKICQLYHRRKWTRENKKKQRILKRHERHLSLVKNLQQKCKPFEKNSQQSSQWSQNIIIETGHNQDQLSTRHTINVIVNNKKKDRQQRYREQNREKLKQREAERRKRIQYLQSIAGPSTTSNINRIELNNEEIIAAVSQNSSGLEETQTSTIQRSDQAKEKNDLQTKRERQQRYREQNREKLKQREAERRQRLKMQK